MSVGRKPLRTIRIGHISRSREAHIQDRKERTDGQVFAEINQDTLCSVDYSKRDILSISSRDIRFSPVTGTIHLLGIIIQPSIHVA
jgi:hypothetical protein